MTTIRHRETTNDLLERAALVVGGPEAIGDGVFGGVLGGSGRQCAGIALVHGFHLSLQGDGSIDAPRDLPRLPARDLGLGSVVPGVRETDCGVAAVAARSHRSARP